MRRSLLVTAVGFITQPVSSKPVCVPLNPNHCFWTRRVKTGIFKPNVLRFISGRSEHHGLISDHNHHESLQKSDVWFTPWEEDALFAPFLSGIFISGFYCGSWNSNIYFICHRGGVESDGSWVGGGHCARVHARTQTRIKAVSVCDSSSPGAWWVDGGGSWGWHWGCRHSSREQEVFVVWQEATNKAKQQRCVDTAADPTWFTGNMSSKMTDGSLEQSVPFKVLSSFRVTSLFVCRHNKM